MLEEYCAVDTVCPPIIHPSTLPFSRCFFLAGSRGGCEPYSNLRLGFGRGLRPLRVDCWQRLPVLGKELKQPSGGRQCGVNMKLVPFQVLKENCSKFKWY